MKIKIACTGDELNKAQQAAKALLAFFPEGTKTRFSSRHKPFFHIYIADSNDGHNDRSSKKRAGSGSRNNRK